ncbi:hypothetical protein N9Y67_00095 [Pseudomonadota bacterium]|nr:hypothetical protein [Pseudomonadota bacterium]
MLKLKINNRLFTGWTGASITRNLKQAATPFNLSLTDKWDQKAWQVKPFDKCELVYNDVVMVSGYIDSASVDYDAEDHSVSISGRSKTADIVDCSVASTQFKNQKIDAIIRALVKPFGINVLIEADAGHAIPFYKADEGVSVFEAIEKLARLRALLITDNGNGDLVLTQAGTQRAPAALVHGQNIKAASASYDVKERFSDYTIKAQQKGSDDIDAVAASQIKASVKDQNVTRYRPLILTTEDQADLRTATARINWEANIRTGLSQTFIITVVGWMVAGVLWDINQIVRLTDPLLGVDVDLLITAVDYSLDESGTLARLTLQPRSALLPEPEITKTKAQKAKEIPVIWTDLNDIKAT